MLPPPDPPEAVVFAGDGQLISQWGGVLESAAVPSTMIVGVHRLADETLRLHEYSPGFGPERFGAHESFFVEEVRWWARSRFGVALPAKRTAVFGVSASGELAALGLRHPEVYGTVFCASPGAGYRPPGVMPGSLPRAYLVAGTLEPFFHQNATRWAEALRDAGADVMMTTHVAAEHTRGDGSCRGCSRTHRTWRLVGDVYRIGAAAILLTMEWARASMEAAGIIKERPSSIVPRRARCAP